MCAPACVAMVALNILPACRELLAVAARPLSAEMTSWMVSLLVIGSHVAALCAVSLIVEAPLAFALAIVLLHRTARRPPPAEWLAAAAAAGFTWRLAFGGTLGFAQGTEPIWSTAILEVWRTLPLATLLFYIPLHRRGIAISEAARLDGSDFLQIVRRVYAPVCAPAASALLLLRTVDYLRVVEAPMISPGAANRIIWVLLLFAVTALASRVARQYEEAR